MKKIIITILIIAAGAYFTYTQFIFNNINTKIFSLDGAVSKIQKEIDSPYVLYNGKKIILGNNLGASITAAFPADLNNFVEDGTIEEEDLNAIEQTIGKTNSATSTTHDYMIRHGANTFDMAFNQVSLDFGLSAATGTFTGVLTATGGFAGKASTTAAFSSNPSNCSAGQYPLGIDDTGAVESCTADVSGTSNLQFIGPNAVRPTTTVGIIVSASSTFAGDITMSNATSSTLYTTGIIDSDGGFRTSASSTMGATSFSGDATGISLSEIEDLTGNKTFSAGTNTLTWQSTNPAGGYLYNLTGAGSAHFFEVRQETGNPGANTHLSHFHADDNDVLPFHIVHTGTPTLGYMQISSAAPTPAVGDIFIVDSNKRVGIGNSGPTSKLTINGGDFVISNSGAATTTIVGNTTATSTIISGLSAGNNAAFVVNQAASANSLYVAANGNVGIGTASPGSTLEVAASKTINFNSSPVSNLTLGTALTGAGNNLNGIGNIQFTSNNSIKSAESDGQYVLFEGQDTGVGLVEVARIQGAADPYFKAGSAVFLQSGNVGIGTTAPGYKLTVSGGGTAITGGDLTVSSAGSATTTISSATSTFVHGLIVDTNSLYVMADSGNVGIGTTTPAALLTVGTTGSGFKVASDGNTVTGMFLYPAFTYTTTTWGGTTTTIPLGVAYENEEWTAGKCFTNAGTLILTFGDGTNYTNRINASTTVGEVAFTSNNTFAPSEKRYVQIGTPASSPTEISCTIKKKLK